MTTPLYKIQIAAENALIIYFGDNNIDDLGGQPSPIISNMIQNAQAQLELCLGQLLVDMTPSYASLLVTFDPFAIDHYQLRRLIRKHLAQITESEERQARIVELPVYYALETGPDLERIADKAQCSVQEVITLHSQQEYQVYAIGFAPGFAFLGQVNERIAMPRLATPRSSVPKGAVAIADQQTAVYPANSPGGWNLIGNCPIDMFCAEKTPHMPVNVGDKVKFVAVEKSEFLALGGQL